MLIVNDQFNQHLQEQWDDSEDDQNDEYNRTVFGKRSEAVGHNNDRDEPANESISNADSGPILLTTHCVSLVESLGKETLAGIIFVPLILSMCGGKGNVRRSKANVLLSCSVIVFCVVVLVKVTQQWIRWRRKIFRERYQLCRRLVFRSLGSIGEPPPARSSICEPRLTIASSSSVLDVLEHFVSSHTKLIQTYDICVASCRVSIGMQLGIGPFSPSTHRVELSAHFRDKDQTYPTSLSTHKVKGVLAALMKRHYACLVKTVPRVDEKNGNEKLPEKSLLSQDIPDIVSLAWLQRGRSEIASLLSNIVGYLLSRVASGEAVSCMNVSVLLATETADYLTHTFSFLSEKSDTDTSEENRKSEIQSLQRQLYATSASLWNLERSAGDVPGTRRWLEEWEKQMTRLYLETQAFVRSEWNQLQQRAESAKPATSYEKEENQNHVRSAIFTDQESFETQPQDGSMLNKSLPSNEERNDQLKAFVFSGRGVQKPVTVISPTMSQSPAALPANKRVSVADHAMLLGELTTRLSRIPQVEEVEVSLQEDDDGDAKDHRNKTGSTKEGMTNQAPVFSLGGVSGGVLSELKAAMMTLQD